MSYITTSTSYYDSGNEVFRTTVSSDVMFSQATTSSQTIWVSGTNTDTYYSGVVSRGSATPGYYKAVPVDDQEIDDTDSEALDDFLNGFAIKKRRDNNA